MKTPNETLAPTTWLTWVTARPDGTLVAIGDDVGRLRVWCPGEARITACHLLGAHVRAATWTHDGQKLLAIAQGGGTLHVFSADGTQREAPIETGHGEVAGLAVHPSKALAATTGKDGCLRVWDLSTGKIALERNEPSEGTVTAMSETPAIPTGELDGDADHATRAWLTAERDRLLDLNARSTADAAHDGDAVPRVLVSFDRGEGAAPADGEASPLDGLRAAPYRSLFDLHSKRREWDAAWCAAAALVLLEDATEDERAYYARFAPREATPALAALDDARLQTLLHEDEKEHASGRGEPRLGEKDDVVRLAYERSWAERILGLRHDGPAFFNQEPPTLDSGALTRVSIRFALKEVVTAPIAPILAKLLDASGPPQTVAALEKALGITLDASILPMGAMGAFSVSRVGAGATVKSLSARYSWSIHHEAPIRSLEALRESHVYEWTADFGETISEVDAALRERFGAPRTVEKGSVYGSFVVAREAPFTLAWYSALPDWAHPQPDPSVRESTLLAIARLEMPPDVDAVAKVAAMLTADSGIVHGPSRTGMILSFVPRMPARELARILGWRDAVGRTSDVHQSSWWIHVVVGKNEYGPVTEPPRFGELSVRAYLAARPSGGRWGKPEDGPGPLGGTHMLGPEDVVRSLEVEHVPMRR